MKQHTFPVPCSRWSRALATVSHDDLSLNERRALAAHLAICPSCSAVQREYQMMDAHILSLPPVAPLEQLPDPVRLLLEEPDDDLSVYFVEGEEYISIQRPFPPARYEARKRRWHYMYVLCSLVASLVVVVLLAGGMLFTAQLHNMSTSTGATVPPPPKGVPNSTVTSGLKTLYNVSAAGRVYAIASDNGVETTTINIQDVTGGIASFDQMLYIGTKNAVVAWETKSWREVWQSPSKAQLDRSLLADGSGVYFGSSDGIHAVQLDTGSPLWRFSRPGCTQCDGTVAAIANGSVYGFSQGLYALNIKNGVALWHDDRFSATTTQVVLASGKLYVSSFSTNQLYILRADNGQQVATMPGGDLIAGAGVVFVGSQKNGTYALRTSDDSQLWDKPDLFIRPLATDKNILYGFTSLSPAPTPTVAVTTPGISVASAPQYTLSGGNGVLYQIQANTGSVYWNNKLPASLDPNVQPLVIDGNLYINTSQGLTGISSVNASVLWQSPDDQVFGDLIAA